MSDRDEFVRAAEQRIDAARQLGDGFTATAIRVELLTMWDTATRKAASVAEGHAERLKHTSHRDGLGMGWIDGEELCSQIAAQIRALPLAGEST